MIAVNPLDPRPSAALPPRTPVAAGTVHLWQVELERVPNELWHTLSTEEWHQAALLGLESERERFILIRAALRAILAPYVGCDRDTLVFQTDASGALSLKEPVSLVRFHLSHSADLLLVAVTFARQIGVDVEFMRPDLPFETLADHYFDPNDAWQLRMLGGREKMTHFYEHWTSSEAKRQAARADRSPADSHDQGRWSLINFTPAEGFTAALAIEGEQFQLNCLSWS